MSDQGTARAVAAIIDVHLVENGLRPAGFDRPTPGDDGVATLGQPHDTVAVVDEQRSEAIAAAGLVEGVGVDVAEPRVQCDEFVEIGDPGSSDVHDLQAHPADEMVCATTP